MGEYMSLSEDDLEYHLTSGQRSWITRLKNIEATHKNLRMELESDMQEVALEVFIGIESTLIQIVRDRLPMDTGRLRAEFEKIVEIQLTHTNFDVTSLPLGGNIFQLGNANIIAEMTINISKLISAVPYAIYHIEELILKDTYTNASIAGTQPLDLTLLADGIRSRVNAEYFTRIAARGWDVEWEKIEQNQKATFDEITRYIGKVGV